MGEHEVRLAELQGEIDRLLQERVARETAQSARDAEQARRDEERIRQGGCEAYISKPISVTSFLETVRRFLG